MRKIIVGLLSVIVIGCSTTLPAAGPTNSPMKNADKILLIVDETPKQAYQNFGQYLASKGFGFASSNETLMTLSTNQSSAGDTTYPYSFDIFVNGSEKTIIQISGTLHAFGTELEILNETGAFGMPAKKGWAIMLGIAKEYPHSEIMYARN